MSSNSSFVSNVWLRHLVRNYTRCFKARSCQKGQLLEKSPLLFVKDLVTKTSCCWRVGYCYSWQVKGKLHHFSTLFKPSQIQYIIWNSTKFFNSILCVSCFPKNQWCQWFLEELQPVNPSPFPSHSKWDGTMFVFIGILGSGRPKKPSLLKSIQHEIKGIIHFDGEQPWRPGKCCFFVITTRRSL